MLNEKKLSKAELAKREELIMKMKPNKRNLIKKYGADAEKVMYGRATNMAKKLAEQDMEQNKLKEMVRAALSQPLPEKKEFPDLTGDGKVTKADILKGRGVELKEVDVEKVLKAKAVSDEDIASFLKLHADDIKGMNAKEIWHEFENFETTNEDIDLGHVDNEPHMIKAELYRIGKYAMELYSMLEELEEAGGEYDFPAWWQAKITTAMNNMVSSKHYLDFELKEPKIDAAVDAMTGEEPHAGELQVMTVDVVDNEDEIEEGFLDASEKSPEELAAIAKAVRDRMKPKEDEIKEGLPKGFWKKETAELDESFAKLVSKLEKQGKSKKAATAIAGAVASYKAKGGGKGPTAKQK